MTIAREYLKGCNYKEMSEFWKINCSKYQMIVLIIISEQKMCSLLRNKVTNSQHSYVIVIRQ